MVKQKFCASSWLITEIKKHNLSVKPIPMTDINCLLNNTGSDKQRQPDFTQDLPSILMYVMYPAFLVILLVIGDYRGGGWKGGMETTGKIRQIEGKKNSPFYWSQTT